MKVAYFAIPLALAGMTLDACADQIQPGYEPTPRVAERIEYGVVERIELYRQGSDSPVGVGAVLGGLAGGVIGHQVGSGRGRDVATIAGALGGAYVGNNIQKANEVDRYRVTMRLDDGARLVLEQAGEGALRVGDRVRVVNNRVSRE